jgi:hypothetical protein
MRPRGENIDKLRIRYDELAASAAVMADRIRSLEAAAEKVHGIIAEYWGPCMGSVESLLTLREAIGERANTWGPNVSDLPRVVATLETKGDAIEKNDQG